ncbi:MAG: sensor histidine kinase, partial [Chitinophagaceae bacterium]
MKLFTRYSRINLLANIAIFLVASVAFYFSLRYVLIKEIDEDLEIEEEEVAGYVQKHDRLPENISVPDQVISFIPATEKIKRHFSILKMQDREDNKEENFRRLSFSIVAGGQLYEGTVSKSLEGSNHLLRSILLISVSTIFAILIVSIIINRVLLKKLWRPFYQSISAVKKFRLSKNQSLVLPPTNIEEFALLNQTLDGIANSSRAEYLALKTFSENASHEIQTPIAIIRSKLDLLIQDEQLTDKQGSIVQSAYNSIEKLSRLNQSLLLLAKIENNQFEDVQIIDLKKKLEEKFLDF